MPRKLKKPKDTDDSFQLTIEVKNGNVELTMIDGLTKTWKTVTYFKKEMQTESLTIGTISKALFEVAAIRYRESAFENTNLKNQPLNLN